MPYLINYNENTKNYYFMNRDYEYIGFDGVKSLGDIDEEYNSYNKRIYMFDDSTKPWLNNKNYKKYVQKIKDTKTENELLRCKNKDYALILIILSQSSV